MLDVDYVYGSPYSHICCLIPMFMDGGDSTRYLYVDGSEELIHKSLKSVLRDIARQEGVMMMKSTDGTKPMYTDPRTYGPHMTFAYLKVRQPIGRSTVYGQFNVAVPFNYAVKSGPTMDTSYIVAPGFNPILVYHSVQHVQRKLKEARWEHIQYIRMMLANMLMSGNKYVVTELYSAWRSLIGR